MRDAHERADFVAKMHKIKHDKIEVKKNYYQQMKTEEDKNRENFNKARMT